MSDQATAVASEGIDPKTGRFLPGNNLSKGRPKGARSKLGEQFLEALQQDFEQHGVAAIQQVRIERPQDYVKVIASLLPSNVNLNVNKYDDLTDEQLIQQLRSLDAALRPILSVAGEIGDSAGASAPTAH